MTFVVMTFLLLACLLTYTTKLLKDAKRKRLTYKKHGKEKKEL